MSDGSFGLLNTTTTHPSKLSDKDIKDYLNYLANERNVAAGTQNQALSALVFLYKEVLDGRYTINLDGLSRAKKPKKYLLYYQN